jgi:hypothetical protein
LKINGDSFYQKDFLCFHILADDPKNDTYSENDGWEFVSLGDQVHMRSNLPVSVWLSLFLLCDLQEFFILAKI